MFYLEDEKTLVLTSENKKDFVVFTFTTKSFYYLANLIFLLIPLLIYR